MAKFVVLGGGKVVIEERSTLKETSSRAFYEELEGSLGVRTPIIPPGTVYFVRAGTYTTLVCEEQPAVHGLLYKGRKYNVGFPYTYFVIRMRKQSVVNVKLFFRNSVVDKPNNLMRWSPLPNQYNDARICLGRDLGIAPSDTLRKKLDLITTYYYNSLFNDDLSDQALKHCPPEIAGRVAKNTGKSVRDHGKDVTPLLHAWEELTTEGVEARSLGWDKYDTLERIVEGGSNES